MEIVTWGPYRLVRHPLYTAFLTALVAAVLVVPALPMALAAAFGFVAISSHRPARGASAARLPPGQPVPGLYGSIRPLPAARRHLRRCTRGDGAAVMTAPPAYVDGLSYALGERKVHVEESRGGRAGSSRPPTTSMAAGFRVASRVRARDHGLRPGPGRRCAARWTGRLLAEVDAIVYATCLPLNGNVGAARPSSSAPAT